MEVSCFKSLGSGRFTKLHMIDFFHYTPHGLNYLFEKAFSRY